MSRITSAIIAGIVAATVAPAAAQTATSRPAADQKPSRYQIGVMERILEGAVEHGAALIRDRLQAVLPATTLVSDNARVRGFRLDGYGVFFDVLVPSLQGTLAWSFRTLDQDDLGLQSALKALKSHIAAAGDPNLDQALRRVELQIGPLPGPGRVDAAGAPPAAVGVSRAAAASSAAQADTTAGKPSDSIVADPEEAYRTAVKQALMEAMVDYSGPLGVGHQEWLTIAARRDDDLRWVAPGDSDARTIVIRISGADLAGFRAGSISREDVVKRMNVQVF